MSTIVNPEKAEAAKACFDYNPPVNTVYVTSNLGCFLKRNDAVNHARGLDNKEIDVFIRSEEDAIIDSDQTESVTDESENVPDARLAVVQAAGGKGKAFTKAVKKASAALAPLDTDGYSAAKTQFGELYQQWNAMSSDDQTSASGIALSAQLSALHEAIIAYEALNPVAPAAAGATGTDGVGATGTDGVGATGTDGVGATGTDSVGATGTDSVGATGTDGVEATCTDGVEATCTDGVVVTGTDGVVATCTDMPAPKAPDENITAKLTELVDEVENLLHLKNN
jgi:hypothetical protein